MTLNKFKTMMQRYHINVPHANLSFTMSKTIIKKVQKSLLTIVILSCFLITCIHWYHVRNMMSSPIDHLRSNILKPLYKLQVGLTIMEFMFFSSKWQINYFPFDVSHPLHSVLWWGKRLVVQYLSWSWSVLAHWKRGWKLSNLGLHIMWSYSTPQEGSTEF